MKRPSLRGLYSPELLEARIAPASFVVTNLSDGAIGSLRNVIGLANATAAADTITFDPAILPGTITLSLAINILNPLTIKGPGIDLLSVSGGDLVRIFNIDDGTASLKATTISGVTLTDGRGAGNGGAIYSTEPLALKNVVVRSSYATVSGGGVFINTPGKISISGSRIVHNQTGGAGGGGGGLYLRSSAGISIVKTTIADNTARHGGGLYARVSGPASVLLIDSSTISNNTATAGNGGGLQLRGVADAKLIVKNSVLTGNRASDAGGGLYLSDARLTVSKTTFSNNFAARGGGIADDNGQALNISGSRFVGNRATGNAGAGGGALYLEGPNIVVKIASTIFTGNRSDTHGGAIAHTDGVTVGISGSSFAGNAAMYNGGALAIGFGGVFTLQSCAFTSNTAANGGAIDVFEAVRLTMKSSILSGNAVSVLGTGMGGAIHAVGSGVLNLTANKFIENSALYGGAMSLTGGMGGNAPSATLSGNLFQANVAGTQGGAVYAGQTSAFTSKSDRFIGNVTTLGAGGGLFLVNTGGIIITGSLIQGNVAGSGSGGGMNIAGDATLTGIKVLDNISGPGGRGGGLRISGVGTNVAITKSIISGNVANDGGGLFYNIGTTTLDAATRAKAKGNAAAINPNIGSA